MKKDNKTIGRDFSGWPIKRMTLQEILEGIGARKIIGQDGSAWIGFKEEDSVLNIFPRTLEDDGMGYGVQEEWITEATCSGDYINMFREPDVMTIERTYKTWKSIMSVCSTGLYDGQEWEDFIEACKDDIPGTIDFFLGRIIPEPDNSLHALDIIFPGTMKYEGYVSLGDCALVWKIALEEMKKGNI